MQYMSNLAEKLCIIRESKLYFKFGLLNPKQKSEGMPFGTNREPNLTSLLLVQVTLSL